MPITVIRGFSCRKLVPSAHGRSVLDYGGKAAHLSCSLEGPLQQRTVQQQPYRLSCAGDRFDPTLNANNVYRYVCRSGLRSLSVTYILCAVCDVDAGITGVNFLPRTALAHKRDIEAIISTQDIAKMRCVDYLKPDLLFFSSIVLFVLKHRFAARNKKNHHEDTTIASVQNICLFQVRGVRWSSRAAW